MVNKKPLFFLIMSVSLLSIVACSRQNENGDKIYERTEFHMGTVIEIRIFDHGSDELLDQAFAKVVDLEQRLTVNASGSEVEAINEGAGIQPVKVSEEVFNLIQYALYYSKKSDGLFNATIGPLTRLWNIGFNDARKPRDSEIQTVLPLLNFENVTLDATELTVFLHEEGMRFDLGAIAKGFMADEVTSLLRENGVTRALVIMGGDLYALGGRADGSPWNIGIRNPFAIGREDSLVGTVPANNQAVATSGVYERYIEVNGQIYHHILNSETGYPFVNDLLGVSVVADTGVLAEAYTTVAFALGIEAGLAYIEDIPGVEAIFISRNQNIYLTSGLRATFNLLNEEFTIY